MKTNETRGGLTRYLSPLEAWALSIGCAVGWGAFVMPGTTFLPLAGPVGTAIGMVAGALLMLIIGVNYHFLMNKYPDAGGTLTYSIRAFGFDHGLLSAWFLMLVYIAIMWANATASVLIVRNLLGPVLQWGFHYQIAGYDVYCGEVLLTLAVIALCGVICMRSKRLAVVAQTVFAIVLVGGVIVCALAVLGRRGGLSGLTPAYSPNGGNPFRQIANIVVLAPWAYVGFESISNSTQGFKFSPKKSIWIMLGALITGVACYALLALTAAAALPPGYASWCEYVADIGNLKGLAGLPTFYAAHDAMGKAGLALLGLTVTGGILTGLIGNCIAASRLMYAMTEDDILPEWFGRLDKRGNPGNAVLFLMLISLFVPFVGSAAIGWIVDVNTIGALIAYGYTSAAAFKLARTDGSRGVQMTGAIGCLVSLMFFLHLMVQSFWSDSTLSSGSYMILIVWSVLGFLFFRMVFRKDTQDRFGKSTALWGALLFIIFFTSMLWLRKATRKTTERVLGELNYYSAAELAQHGVTLNETETADAEYYLQLKMDDVADNMTRNSWGQMAVIVIALLIMFDIYRAIMQREKRVETQKMQVEKAYEKAQGISAVYAHIAQAFSANCSQVYYVNLDTDEYTAFRSGAGDGGEVTETQGERFFDESRKSAQTLIYAEDLDAFNRAFTKESVLQAVDENGEFTMNYRLIMDGAPVRTILKAARVPGDERYLVIDVSSDDLVNARNELTGLRMEEAMHLLGKSLLEKHPEGWCLIALDLEHFRLFNEWYGRDAGDELLRQIGARFADVEAETEGLACYLGQDDFVLFAPYDEGNIQRLFRDVHEYIMEHGTSVGFMPAIGVCMARSDISVDEMFDRALQASQHAKENYHQRIRVFEEAMYQKTEQDYQILSDFQQALSNQELFIVLQPQCSIDSGKIVGAESLVRWKKADGTMVSPGVFVPVLEQYGFVTDMDQFVWEEVCRWQREWIDGGHTPLPVSVNVSQIDIFTIDVPSHFELLLWRYKLPVDVIKIEITESAYVGDDSVADTVKRLREKGFLVLMDDFGSGYSSLNMLRNLNVDIIKLDAQFLRMNSDDRKGVHILKSIVGMAQSMETPIIVEGVETEEETEFIKELGCRYVQGYHFYRPMPVGDFEALIGDETKIDTAGFSL